MFSHFVASPRGAFLAELPLKGNSGGLLSTKLTDEGQFQIRYKFL